LENKIEEQIFYYYRRLDMKKDNSAAKAQFDVVLGFDMETDIGSFTHFYCKKLWGKGAERI